MSLLELSTNTTEVIVTNLHQGGTGEWRRGQQSWNISVINEVRGGHKGTIGINSGMGIAHLIETIFAQEKNHQNK